MVAPVLGFYTEAELTWLTIVSIVELAFYKREKPVFLDRKLGRNLFYFSACHAVWLFVYEAFQIKQPVGLRPRGCHRGNLTLGIITIV